MSCADETDLGAVIAAARAEYRGRLPSRLAEIERLADAGRWGAVAHAAHKLRGSAGVYGFAALAVAAGELEDALTVAEGAAAEPPQVALRGLREQLALAIRELP